jgi:hypothetical protein
MTKDDQHVEKMQYTHFYTYVVQPVPLVGPIDVLWCSGSGGKKCGILRVTMGPTIGEDMSSRPLLAELATIYHYWCDQPGGTRIKDGRNMTFHVSHAAQIKSFITDHISSQVNDVVAKASRLMAIRFMDAFVEGDSFEFFKALNAKNPMNTWDRHEYFWRSIQKPILQLEPLGTVTITYAAAGKWANQTDYYRRGAWAILRKIGPDSTNVLVDQREVNTDHGIVTYYSVFAPRTGTLFHCLRNDQSKEIVLYDLDVFPSAIRQAGKVVLINRDYGDFTLDISPVANTAA